MQLTGTIWKISPVCYDLEVVGLMLCNRVPLFSVEGNGQLFHLRFVVDDFHLNSFFEYNVSWGSTIDCTTIDHCTTIAYSLWRRLLEKTSLRKISALWRALKLAWIVFGPTDFRGWSYELITDRSSVIPSVRHSFPLSVPLFVCVIFLAFFSETAPRIFPIFCKSVED